jgi:RNA polymerase sigma-70 factor (ECF subfamily)
MQGSSPIPCAPASEAEPDSSASPSAAVSDEDLLCALQQRDVRGLEVLYDRHCRLAYGLAYRLVGDSATAEDIVQEAFLSVWRQAATFDSSRGSVRTWLLSIVHHRAVDWLRSQANQRPHLQLDVVDHVLSTPDIWQDVALRADREAVRRALAALPVEQQRTVVLAYFAGYSQPEIAAAMGVPLSTVKGRMRLALHRLRLLLIGADALAANLAGGPVTRLPAYQPIRSAQ